MLVLNFNINDEVVEILPQDRDTDAYLTSLNICNKFSGGLVIALYKKRGVDEFYIVDSISLAEKESFTLQQVTLEKTHALYAEVIGGPASIILEYFPS